MSSLLDSVQMFGRRLPMEYQTENAECGLACIAMIASYHGYKTDLVQLRSKFKVSLRGVNAHYLSQVATKINMVCTGHRVETGSLNTVNLPAIMHWDMHHFVVCKEVNRKGIVVHDPKEGIRHYTWEQMSPHFTGGILELTPGLEFEPHDDRKKMSLRRIMGRVTGLKRSLIQAAVLAAALEVFSILMPMATQIIIDDTLVTKDFDLLWLAIIGYILLGCFRAAATWVRNLVLLHLGATMSIQWVANVIQHMLKLEDEYFARRHMGDTMSRFSSVTTIQQTLTVGILTAVLDGIMAIAFIVVMYIYSAKLATVALIAVIIYALIRWLRFEKLRWASAGQLQIQARQQSKFIELVRGVRTIKMFNAQEDSKGRYMSLAIDSMNNNIIVQRLNYNFATLTVMLLAIESALILGLGAWDMMKGTGLSIGMLMAIMAYKDQFTTRITSLVDNVIQFFMLRLHVDRLADLVLSPPEQDLVVMGPEQEVEPSIELIDVGFKYSSSEQWIVRHVNIRILPGESVVLVGPSGCGKTTLLMLMMHILKPSEGQVLIGGKPMSQIGLSRFRDMVGAVMQDDRLFNGSVASNISFWPKDGVDDEQVEKCAKLAMIHDDITMMPNGYQTLINESASGLSGGQKQRMFVARALYKKPRILFLDEATSSLDPLMSAQLCLNIGDLKMTRVVIAHSPETVKASGRPILVNPQKWLPSGNVIAHPTGLKQDRNRGSINQEEELQHD